MLNFSSLSREKGSADIDSIIQLLLIGEPANILADDNAIPRVIEVIRATSAFVSGGEKIGLGSGAVFGFFGIGEPVCGALGYVSLNKLTVFGNETRLFPRRCSRLKLVNTLQVEQQSFPNPMFMGGDSSVMTSSCVFLISCK